jgi:peptide/nickel transport system permease protein
MLNLNKKKEFGTSQWTLVWNKLSDNKFALVSLWLLLGVIVIAIFAPLIAPYPYAEQNYDCIMLSPNWQHLFGTDQFGRDIFSRIIYGSRYTVFIGFGTMTGSCITGVTLGVLAGFYHKLDNPIMRTLEIFSNIPDMILLMLLITIMGISLRNLVIALIMYYTPGFARIARAKVLTLRNEEFVEASIALGASDRRILLTHILPNALAPIIIRFTLSTGGSILEAAALSFIGLGIQPPKAEWGLMISQGRQYLSSYWQMAIIPGLCIVFLTYILNYLGDGLRDALDPKLNN